MGLDVYLSLPVEDEEDDEEVFSANITHNLGEMAAKAGIYNHLWRPEELGITKAAELIEPLRKGLCKLVKDPDHFKAFESPNGWGTYDGLIRFVSEYLVACVETPEAKVHAWR